MFLSVEKFTPLLRPILCAATLLAAALSSGCTDPVNAPRALSDYASNTLFTSFSGRSPKTLDPQVSYSSDETIYTYGVYEPLYGYEYLKRPYTLMPLTAEKVVKPVYLDADKKVLSEGFSQKVQLLAPCFRADQSTIDRCQYKARECI